MCFISLLREGAYTLGNNSVKSVAETIADVLFALAKSNHPEPNSSTALFIRACVARGLVSFEALLRHVIVPLSAKVRWDLTVFEWSSSQMIESASATRLSNEAQLYISLLPLFIGFETGCNGLVDTDESLWSHKLPLRERLFLRHTVDFLRLNSVSTVFTVYVQLGNMFVLRNATDPILMTILSSGDRSLRLRLSCNPDAMNQCLQVFKVGISDPNEMRHKISAFISGLYSAYQLPPENANTDHSTSNHASSRLIRRLNSQVDNTHSIWTLVLDSFQLHATSTHTNLVDNLADLLRSESSSGGEFLDRHKLSLYSHLIKLQCIHQPSLLDQLAQKFEELLRPKNTPTSEIDTTVWFKTVQRISSILVSALRGLFFGISSAGSASSELPSVSISVNAVVEKICLLIGNTIQEAENLPLFSASCSSMWDSTRFEHHRQKAIVCLGVMEAILVENGKILRQQSTPPGVVSSRTQTSNSSSRGNTPILNPATLIKCTNILLQLTTNRLLFGSSDYACDGYQMSILRRCLSLVLQGATNCGVEPGQTIARRIQETLRQQHSSSQFWPPSGNFDSSNSDRGVIDDFFTSSSKCNRTHAALTPAMFGARLLGRRELRFAESTQHFGGAAVGGAAVARANISTGQPLPGGIRQTQPRVS